jgi:hypothetical protein
MGKKKIESNFIFDFLSQRFKQANNRYNMQTQTQTTSATSSPLDILQQFDGLLKTHSIVVNDRENLAILFEKIVELCTQMPKTKLKAAIKAATQEPKTTKPKGKAQPKTKAQSKTQESMVGPEGAADAPVISDLPVVRGRGRPRKAAAAETIAPASEANPNAETAEKKRRGRPKKDKTVTISSNDDEDALIEKMMADVASMQKDEEVVVHTASAVAAVEVDDDETDTDDEMSPIESFSGKLMRSVRSDSMSPVIHTPVVQSFDIQVEADVPLNAVPASKGKKEPKAKVVKEPKAKVTKVTKVTKEPKSKEPKAKEPKSKVAKEPKAKVTKAKEANAVAVDVAVDVAVASSVPESIVVASKVTNVPLQENTEVNGVLCLTSNFPTTSFTYNGRTYLRTETDNVYDTMTREMIGVWDHANHEIIHAFDEDEEEMLFSDEE